MKDYFHSTLKS